MDTTIAEAAVSQNPQVFIKSIKFNDGTRLTLNHNSIVVFTGANNCGKSQILKDIEHWFNKDWQQNTVVINEIDAEFNGSFNDNYFSSRFFSKNGWLGLYEEPGNQYNRESVVRWWEHKQLHASLYKLFIKLINTEQRLTTSNAPQFGGGHEGHPIYKLYKNNKLVQVLSAYFKEAFGVDLEVNHRTPPYVPLHVGIAPKKEDYTMDKQDDYYRELEKLPRLDEQGDGMRSFASILLDTFTTEHSITLIDEPEAFLHPPQARLLGKMLAKHNPNNRQLVISTHSDDFLHGILDLLQTLII